jgi:hypothetical protein
MRLGALVSGFLNCDLRKANHVVGIQKYLVLPATFDPVPWNYRLKLLCTFDNFHDNEICWLVWFPGFTGPTWRGHW